MVKVVIRKYPHRRLYNATAGNFIKLCDVTPLIKAGADVSVHDRRTGQDITKSVLSRIVLQEEAKSQSGPLTLNVMRNLIRLTASDQQGLLPAFLGHLAMLLQTVSRTSDQRTTAPGLAGAVAAESARTPFDEELETLIEHTNARRAL
jgi:polyhydroxyalkanoate synthesis repressor PhaR